jgi:hypothetical protein
MFGVQPKHVLSIRHFLLGLVILSLACQTAIRLLNQNGKPLPIDETAPTRDLSAVDSSGTEKEVGTTVDESEPNSQENSYGSGLKQEEVDQTAMGNQAADRLSIDNNPEESLVDGLTALVIQKQGYGQNEQELAYAFLVHNPNPDLTIADSEYQVIAYDQSGRVVLTDTEFISFILPGQSLGIAGNMYLEEDVLIEDLVVQVQTGKPHFDKAIPALDVQAVEYRPGEYFDRVTGLIAGPKNHDVEDLRVSAIAYDNAGEIIGAGYSFVSFIKAGKTTGVEVTITNDGIVDRVELFPRLSLSFVDFVGEKRSKNVQDLSLLQTDFVQNDQEVGYGFLIENPNQNLVAEDNEYRITVYDSAGKVILVDEGYIDRLMPGQPFGFGSTFFVEEGEEVESIDLQLKTGSFRRSELFPTLETGNVKILGDQYSNIVTGEIVNRHDQAFEDIRVSAVVFDANDQIVGGGFTWLDDIAANDRLGVEIWINSVGEPVSVRLFASAVQLKENE